MTSTDNDLLSLSDADAFVKSIGGRSLDATDPYEKDIMEEAQPLNAWTSTSPRLVVASGGTRACSCNVLVVDREQLRKYFESLPPPAYKTAIFFALAHEYGHFKQFQSYQDRAITMPRVEIEAHADLLSGVWLAIRTYEGTRQHIPNELTAAAMRLKGALNYYPSPYQRACLVTQGMCTGWLTCEAIRQVPLSNIAAYKDCLTPDDVLALYRQARTTLRETPIEEPR